MIIKHFFTIILLLAALVCTAASFTLLYLTLPSKGEQNQNVVIQRGISTQNITKILADAKIIRFQYIFNALAKIQGLFGYHLKSGEYAFTERMTPLQIFRILISGQSVIHKFTVIEGSTIYNIIIKLRNEPLLTGEIDDDITEGFLMPATYFFSFGDERQKLISQMKRLMSNALDEFMPILALNSPIKTRMQALALASIVEKEAYLEVEKPRIAAVFLNRLKNKMRLQADPTTIYALTMGKYELERSLSKNDLLIKSPYNTYYIIGLPPTPIACPSRTSLEAVFKPTQSDDLYFVVNGSGGHNFAKDLSDHNNNVQIYKKLRNNNEAERSAQ